MTKFVACCSLLVACCIPGCISGSGSHPVPVHSPQIAKGAIFSAITGMEASPVVFNGELLYVGSMLSPASTVVVRQSDSAILATLPSMGFISAIGDKGALYVFGTSDSGSSISVISSSDLVHWTTPTKIYTAQPGRKVFNTSVAVSPAGYVMAYEISDGTGSFNSRFLQSADLIHWRDFGTQYKVGAYTACPTIRYVDGFFYLFYLTYVAAPNGLQFSTKVARSPDLTNWKESTVAVLSGWDEAGMNASDMDFVELNGQLKIVYSNLSQQGLAVPNTGLREASYNGTLAQFVRIFF